MDFPLDKQNYELLHKIGDTKTGTYWVARCNLNGKLVCIKLINLDLFPVTIDELRKGVSFWATSTNNNLIQYYGAFITDSTLWFLSEYMDGGSIGNIMSFAYQQGFKDEVLLASILEQVLLFLDYWHENHQIHRDIRPDNIMISNDGDVKVGSLGCATCLIQNGQRKRARFTRIGTVSYTAPEAFLENGYTEKADIWSLGITAVELATGKNPYSSYEQMSIPMHVMSDNPPELKSQLGFSTKFSNFIKDCLQSNPSKRLSAKELLKSSFIKMSKGKKYIAAILMSNMPPVYKRYEMLHPTEPATESDVPAWAKIASNFKFQVSPMKQKSKSLSEIQNKSESNSSDDSPSSPSDTLNNPVRKGRFMVTYSRKGSRKCIPKFSLSRSISEEFENRKSSEIDEKEVMTPPEKLIQPTA